MGDENSLVERDPVYLADKPKRPIRIPVWLEKDEQDRLNQASRNIDDRPENIFRKKHEHVLEVRRCYDFLFGLIQNSGLRINEALQLKIRDVRLDNMLARSMRVKGKGDKERLVPLPETFGQVFRVWLKGRGGEEFVFEKELGGKPPGGGHRPPEPTTSGG